MWQNLNWRKWRLLLKLDPDKRISGTSLERLLKQIIFQPSVDGVIIGGTQNITSENTEDLIDLVRETDYSGPLIQEISEITAISLNVNGYLLPIVLNTGSRDWFIGKHLEAVKKFGHLIDWSEILPEAYLICNPRCAAAELTEVIPPSLDDLIAYLDLVEEVYRLPIVYLEYSGIYGNVDWLKAIKERCRQTHLFYGGGIKSLAQAEEMMAVADTVILGNIIYDDPEGTLKILESII
ncbi:MAG: heptaprenylglyceryl phosphate synthase [Bacillota bacterium]|jgi:putative glycerol-1-phosphate prenyltransferase